MKKMWIAVVVGLVAWSVESPRFAVAQAAAETEPSDAVKESRGLVQQAINQLQQNHLDDAIELIESAIDKDLENNRALLLAGEAYSRKGVEMASKDRKGASKPLRRGAELMRKLAERKKDLSPKEKEVLALSVYNEACCLAIDGEADKALEILEEAIKLGFEDLDLMGADPDFESIRQDERFKKLLASVSEETSKSDKEVEADEEGE